MKILFDFQDTVGGAPRSHLEHAKAMQKNNHEIISLIEEGNDTAFFSDLDTEIHYIDSFKRKKIRSVIKNIKKYRKLVEFIRPDLIYANRSSQCIYLSIVSDLTGVPLLCARAGGQGVSKLNRVNTDRDYIVYSDESKKELINLGFDQNRLHVIRNRIPEIENNSSYNESTKKRVVTILLIGNIKKDTINGWIYFFNLILNYLDEIHLKFKLQIAGKYINLNKSDIKIYEQSLNTLNNSNKIIIERLGWIENISDVILGADICIGKGRSVIQPLMAGKIGFVLSEDGYLFRCSKNNYRTLRLTNFTGRRVNATDNNGTDLIEMLNCQDWNKYSNDITDVIKRDYSNMYIYEKLSVIIHKVTGKKSKPDKLKAYMRFLEILILKISN